MKTHGGRSFLNQPGHHSSAAIIAEIEDTEGWRRGKNGRGAKIVSTYGAQPWCQLIVSDCHRSISLDLDFTDAEGRENSYHKVCELIRVLTRFKKGLLIEMARYEDRTKNLEKTEEEE